MVDEANRALEAVPGLLSDSAPFVRFIPGFGQFSLDFTLICSVGNYIDQYLVQHELRKRIYKRFRDEGIEFPVPQREVRLSANRSNEILFPTFRSRDLLRGIDDNITANLASSKTLDEIGNPGLMGKIWPGSCSNSSGSDDHPYRRRNHDDEGSPA